ncbi:hypothetical protein PIB30_028062 [Stylosanthes scabra]|uniref:Uncharacterized protein n=1 Tax=Stylosanthes scabra TaxID=79078 RepID=A0ABU6RBF0_9FABA|nr:hypothetical protein [Stylosanthes scabra]
MEEDATTEHLRHLSRIMRRDVQQGQPPAPHRFWLTTPKRVMRALNIPSRHELGIEYVPDRDWSKALLTKSHQTMLRLMCHALQVPPPGYLHETMATDTGATLHRFIVAIPPGTGVDAVSAASCYSYNELLARDDVAAALAKILLREDESYIHDLNNEVLEEIIAENGELRREIRALRRRVAELRGGVRQTGMVHGSTSTNSSSSQQGANDFA